MGMVDPNPEFDVAAEWNSEAFYQYLMRQSEVDINHYLMGYALGGEPSGDTSGLTKADKAELVTELVSED